MRILLCHNFYQQRGGEDAVFADEGALLEKHGHDVERFSLHNDAVKMMNSLTLTRNTVWSSASHVAIGEQVRRFRPDVVHFHNTFPLISPAAYSAARLGNAAVVQTLHNYRLLCPNAFLFREGRICEECLKHRLPWPGIVHACYRGSRRATAAVTVMLTVHRLRGTWKSDVDAYVALTAFSRQKFIDGGIPAGKIHVKPNFVDPDPGCGSGTGDYAIFVGRLSPEKGVATLLAAWKILNGEIPLKIVGDGPLAAEVREAAGRFPKIEFLGRQPRDQVYSLMGRARFLVFPSLWYEGLPLTVVEAFAKGTPILASRLGAMAELIDAGRTGLLFTSGDAEELAARARELVAEPTGLAKMRLAARAEFEEKYTADQNNHILESVYRIAVAARRLEC